MTTSAQGVQRDQQSQQPGDASLAKSAHDHLWMHFTRMSTYDSVDVPVIVRGEGAYIYDDKGKRYLDGLAGLKFLGGGGHLVPQL